MSALKIGKRYLYYVSAGIWWLAALSTSMVPNTAEASDTVGNIYTALTAGFREGDFGTTINSELYSLTPEFGYIGENYDLSASIPLQQLHISGNGISYSESGVGDATLRAGRQLWKNSKTGLSFTASLNIKLATGDENKGLGTGGTDVGASLSSSRKIGAYSYTALVGYTQVGEPSGISYNNVVSYGIGANRAFSRTNAFVTLQGQTSAIPGGVAPLEFDVGFFHIISQDYVFITYGLLGLSDGSPNDGVSLGIVRWL